MRPQPGDRPGSIQGAEDGEAALPGLFEEIDKAEGFDAIIIACFDDTGLYARAQADARSRSSASARRPTTMPCWWPSGSRVVTTLSVVDPGDPGKHHALRALRPLRQGARL